MLNFLRKRSVKYGGNAVTGVMMMLGVLVLVNFLATRYSQRFDLTEGNIYSLSDQTVALLSGLDKDVNMVAFYREQTQPAFENLLEIYAYNSSRIRYRFVDPDTNPAEAKRYGIRSYGTTVLEAGGKEERISTSDERELTNAIARVIRDTEKKVYSLTGHGEKSMTAVDRNGYSQVLEALQRANYVVRDTFLLARAEAVPGDCSLLLIAGPTKPLLDSEITAVQSYLEAGGAALILLDPAVVSGLEPFLESWGVDVGNNYVVDSGGMGRLFNLDYSMPMGAEYGNHPVTEKHKGLMTAFLLARTVGRSGNRGGKEIVELVKTASASWGESDLSSLRGEEPEDISFDSVTDKRGPVPLAVAVTSEPSRPSAEEAERKTRLVVFGDSDFANNQLFSFQGNGDLFMNAVSWLMEDGELIAIRQKERGFRPISLTAGDEQVVFWFSIFLLPAIPLVAGIIVWWKRR
jgi:ABC-type uncharacterized transport system involved in gliding motility auxiliary subunit